MGCSEAKAIDTHSPKIIPIRQIDNTLSQNNKINSLNNWEKQNHKDIDKQQNVTGNFSSNDQTWSEFQHRDDAIDILFGQELKSKDFQFLITNQIWVEEWFQIACTLLKISPKQNQTYENQIMKLFLHVKLKQAKFLQSKDINQVLCEKCYHQQLERFAIPKEQVDPNLFEICQICKGIGWIQQKNTNHMQQKVHQIDCTLCAIKIQNLSDQIQCPNCNTLGFTCKL